jgi:hypothetical protein
VKTVVNVSLQVLAQPQGNLVVTPSTVTFNDDIGGPLPAPWVVGVTSTGSPVNFYLATSAAWLFASSPAYVTNTTITVSANPLPSMGPGVYNGTVYVYPVTGGAPTQIAVTLRITATGTLTASPTFLSFTYQPGGVLPPGQILNIVNSAGGNIAFTAAASTVSGGQWLSVSPANSITPGVITAFVSPTNLLGGTYSGTITITPTVPGVSPTQIPVTLTIYNVSQLVVTPASLYYNYQSGGSPPTTQYVSVTATGSSVPFKVSVLGPTWVTTTATGGGTPTGIGVIVNPPSSTPPGPYSATVTMAPTNGSGAPVSVQVSISITSANYLTLGRTSVSFNSTVNGTAPPPAIVPVTSSGGSIRFETVASTLGFGQWLSVYQSSQYTPANLSINVNPAGLAAGTYTGSVLVTSEEAVNGSQNINVTLVVSATTSLYAQPYGLVFSYQTGSAPPPAQVFVVGSQGGTTTFTISTTTSSGGAWLSAAGSGSTPTAAAAAVNPTSLGAGTYTGQILITSSDTTIPQLQIPVVLNVSPGPVYVPSTNELAFQWQTGGVAPASQQVTINANNASNIVFYPTWVTADGANWLSVAPTVSSTPGALTVSITPGTLTAGQYYGLIAINDPAGAVPISFIPVRFQVTSGPVLGVPSQGLLFSTQAGLGAPAPQFITVNSVGPQAQFTATPSASWIQVTPTSGFSGTQITVSVNTSGLQPGYYLGVVSISIPGIANSTQLVPVALTLAAGF